MSPTVILAVLLTVASMVAAVASREHVRLRALTGIALGAVMLAVAVVPAFPRLLAAAIAGSVVLVVLGSVIGMRLGAHGPLDRRQKISTAIPLIDSGFMAAALLLMPTHAIVALAASAHSVGSHDLHAGMAGGVMTWFVLLAWAVSAAVLIIPALVRRPRESYADVACTGCMIAAMVAMMA
jgi:hypothetical protein